MLLGFSYASDASSASLTEKAFDFVERFRWVLLIIYEKLKKLFQSRRIKYELTKTTLF